MYSKMLVVELNFWFSFQSLSHVRLFVTPWISAHQASLYITNSQSSFKLMSIESVMPSAISSSVVPFSSCPQSFPASGSFPMSQLFAWGGQSIGVSASASVLPIFPSIRVFHLMWTAESLEKSLMLGKIEGRRRGHQRMRWLDGITDAMDINSGKLWEMVRDREAWRCSPWGCKEWDTTWQLNNNTVLVPMIIEYNQDQHTQDVPATSWCMTMVWNMPARAEQAFLVAQTVKNLPAMQETFDPWEGKTSWRRKNNPLQYCCPENPMDRGVWPATVHGVTKSQTRLSDLHTHTHTHTHSWTGEITY